MTCKHCQVQMLPGEVLVNVATPGAPDFPGENRVVTMSYGKESKLTPCLKCPKCGYSVVETGTKVFGMPVFVDDVMPKDEVHIRNEEGETVGKIVGIGEE